MRRHVIAAILLVLSGVAIWGSIDLAVEHFRVGADPNYQSWCTFEDSNFDCAAVAASRWAQHQIFLFRYPVPTAMFPLGFFVGFAVLIGLGWVRGGDENYSATQARDDTLAFAWLMLLPAAVVDLLLIYVMKFQLQTWCIVCLVIDVTTLSLLIGTPLARSRGYRGLLGDGLVGMFRHGNWIALLVIFATVVVVGQRRYSLAIDEILAETREEFVAWYAEQSPVDAPLVREGNPRRGTPDAPWRVVEFADFQCPFCAGCSHDIHRLMEAYPGQIEFVFRHYPLGQDCAPGLMRDSHPEACMAAYAVDCAGRHGKYWEMYDVLFEMFPAMRLERKRPTLEDIREAAHELGLPATEFYYCLEDEEIKAAVTQSVLDGRAAGVSGTPAVFANGIAIPGGGNAPVFLEWLIRARLEEQGQELDDPLLY